jgi:hypothetical protein
VVIGVFLYAKSWDAGFFQKLSQGFVLSFSSFDDFSEAVKVLFIKYDRKLLMLSILMVSDPQGMSNYGACRSLSDVIAKNRSNVRQDLGVTIDPITVALKPDGF